ncbi:MAG: hypothetical protein K2O29_07255 [Ruminococcus sp.]|nr:hypothetical protein [Ruminococcus sp.]MDE7138235.1 hypothetical protein [Ruminococcus sp.]
MDLHEVFLASEIAGKSNGNGGSADLSDYYTKSQTDGLLVNKIDKVNGMGLSENSFTDAEKTKLSLLENYDDTEIRSQIVKNRTTLGYQCKNLLKNTAVSGTHNGIPYTVNSDGSVTCGTGTATGSVSFLFINSFTFKGSVSYILSGAPDDNSAETRISLIDDTGGESQIHQDRGSGVTVKFDEDTTRRVRVRFCSSGATITQPVTFFPMIRLAGIVDDTYEPYKPSVAEYIADLEARITALEER